MCAYLSERVARANQTLLWLPPSSRTRARAPPAETLHEYLKFYSQT